MSLRLGCGRRTGSVLPALAVLLAASLVFGVPLAAQDAGSGADDAGSDPLDGLFDNPPAEDAEAEDAESEDDAAGHDDGEGQASTGGDEGSESLRELFETSDTVDVEGSVGATAGFGAGWTEYPTADDPWEGFATSLNLSTRAGFTFDARPDPALRVYGSLFTEIDPEEDLYSWSAIQIEELFFDYIWNDTVFTRTGTFGMRWGQARIFTPGDFVEDSDEGLAVRASVPILLDGITAVTMAREEYFESEDLPGYRAVAYASKLDWVVGPVLSSLGGRWRGPEGAKGLFSTKTVLFSTDLLSDLVVYYDEEEDLAWGVVAGFYREIRDIQLYGEYYYDGRTEGGEDHNVGLTAGVRSILGSKWGIGLQWEHTFLDDSGRLVSGISWSPLEFITARLGVPWFYGEDGSRYVEDNDDPQGRRLAVGLELVLQAAF